MRQILLDVSSLILSATMLLLGNSLLSSLLGVRLAAGEVTSLTSGLVMSGYFAGLLAGSLLAHHAFRLVGHIRTFAAFASIFSAATLAHALDDAPVFWGILRAIEGFSVAGLFMCIDSWLNSRAGNENRARVLSVYMVSIYIAQAAGQFLLTVPDPSGTTLFILASIVLSMSLVPVAMTRAPAPPLPTPSSFSFVELYRLSPTGVLGSFASGVLLGSFYSLGAYYAQVRGFDAGSIALFMSAGIAGGLVVQWPVGRLSDRMDRRTVIVGSCAALSLLSFGVIGAAELGWLPLLLTVAIFGGLCNVLYPLSVAHANDSIDQNDMVAAAGGLLLAYAGGAVAGPIAASAVMDSVGPNGLFIFEGGIALLAAAFILYRMTRRSALPNAEQSDFVPMASFVSPELDPRVESDQMAMELSGAAPDHAETEGEQDLEHPASN